MGPSWLGWRRNKQEELGKRPRESIVGKEFPKCPNAARRNGKGLGRSASVRFLRETATERRTTMSKQLRRERTDARPHWGSGRDFTERQRTI